MAAPGMVWAREFFLLLGLLAFTGWLLGGLTDGIRVAGQSTSRVLSLFTTVVIVLAGSSSKSERTDKYSRDPSESRLISECDFFIQFW